MPEIQIFVLRPSHMPAPIVKLHQGVNLVGRDSICNVILFDSSVSRFHAEILVREATISVRDLDSRNGTYVEGKRIQSANVQAGQQLQFGCVQLQVAKSGANDLELGSEPETQSVSDVFEWLSTDSGKVLLTTAERRVFDLILSGLAEKEVAHRLEISANTVHCHVRKIYDAFGVSSRAELMARFIRPPTGNSGTPEKTGPMSPGP
jgi:pSer/pThr/pTyr-binding forkhead associated (FHA) protein